MRYRIPDLPPTQWHAAVIEVEKSQFLAWVCHAPDKAAFDALLHAAKSAHPNASHHCNAFIAGPPGEQTHVGFSDDGEPGGTAGRPMFQALLGSQLGEIGCVVTRYFGGTKLGTGGLGRAYAQAVNAGLETLPTREVIERENYQISVDFAHEASARAWCDEQDIPVLQADYDGSGVRLMIGWPKDISLDISGLESRLKTPLTIQQI